MRKGFRKYSRHKTKAIASIVMLLVVASPYVAYLAARHQKTTTTHAAAACTISPILVNSCRPWLGARSTAHREVASDLKTQLLYHEQLIGRQVDVVHDYATPGAVLSSFDVYAANRAGTYLFLNYKPAGNWADASGGNATVNANIDKMANSIKNNVGGKKMFITIWHEPENDLGADSNCPGTNFKGPAANTPASYKTMWQNVRNRFAADGVTNIVWAVDYMNYAPWNCVVPDLYPGDSLVDWVVFNGYSNGGGNWDTIISRFYNLLTTNSNSAHNFLSKPWGISEWGIDNSTQAQAYSFYDQVKASLDANTFPKLKLYMIFDSIAPAGATPGGHHIEEGTAQVFDQTEVNHYKAFANDPLITGSAVITPPPPSDTTPPTVSITSPANGAAVSGVMSVAATASDSGGVAKVVFSIDGTAVSTDTTAPFAVSIDTTKYTNADHTVAATAYDAAGNSKPAQIGIVIQNAVSAPPAKPTLTADKSAIQVGDSVLLSWSSAGAVSCILTPGNISSSGASGSKLVANIQQTTTYTVTCSNSKGRAASSLQVIVSAKPPVTVPIIISFTATPGAVMAGATSTLRWAASNVATNGCAITPGPLSSTSADGQWQTPVLTASTSYTITCKDTAGKIASRSVSVTVNGIAPPSPPAGSAPSSPPTSASVVHATGGQQVINAEADDSVNAGQLISLDPGNVVDPKKVANILRVEYYNGGKLLQTVSSPPYALNTKSLPSGTYTITERTYYGDGSNSERTQDITVKNASVLTTKKPGSRVVPAVLLGIVVLVGAIIVYAIRRLGKSRSTASAAISGLNPDEIIVGPQPQQTVQPPQPPAVSSDDPNNWPPTGMPQ